MGLECYFMNKRILALLEKKLNQKQFWKRKEYTKYIFIFIEKKRQIYIKQMHLQYQLPITTKVGPVYIEKLTALSNHYTDP